MSASVTELRTGQDEHKRRMNDLLVSTLGEQVTPLLADSSVTEIMLNPDGTLWVEQLGQPMRCFGRMAANDAERFISVVASTLQTQIDRENPILECELPLDGSRFEALVPPVVSAPTFTIRKKAIRVFTLTDYMASGIMSAKQMMAIADAAEQRKNILVVGGTGSGKTTLTNAIIRHIAEATPQHRIAIIEDTSELQCTAENAVTLRAVDHVDMIRLLKATMRLRPDRIIVGEVRDGAALALLKAWNTGHPGGVATLHANSAAAGLIRMEQLVAEASPAPMQSLIAEAVDIIVAIVKTAKGRRVSEVIQVSGFNGHDYQTAIIGD